MENETKEKKPKKVVHDPIMGEQLIDSLPVEEPTREPFLVEDGTKPEAKRDEYPNISPRNGNAYCVTNCGGKLFVEPYPSEKVRERRETKYGWKFYKTAKEAVTAMPEKEATILAIIETHNNNAAKPFGCLTCR